MTRIRILLLAVGATVAVAVSTAMVGVAPASAATCDQQGRRVLIKGVWHKVVRRGHGWVDCGLGW